MTQLMNISAALANSDLFKSLQQVNDKLAGGSSDYKRISLKGGKFRLMVGGEQVGKPRNDELNIIILDAAPISRTYYEGNYDPNASAPPTCWSPDGKAPDAKVPADQRQSDKCATCPMAVKGSGQGNTAACRFGQRLAVAIEGDMEEVYQLQLPSKSIFGAAENGNMPLQAYAKFLNGHKAPAIAVVTSMYFDEDSDTPKVFFKPVRSLTEEELQQAVALRDSDETRDAITMTVSETDRVEPAAEAPAKKPVSKTPVIEEDEEEEEEEVVPVKKPAKKAPAKKVVEEEEEEEIPEPVKVSAKKQPKPAEVDDELAGLIDEWDE